MKTSGRKWTARQRSDLSKVMRAKWRSKREPEPIMEISLNDHTETSLESLFGEYKNTKSRLVEIRQEIIKQLENV